MMNQLLLRLIILGASLLLLWAGTRIVIYMAQRTPPPERAWVALTGAIGVLGAPVIGLLLVELISGRALTRGFRVIRRREAPGEYWFYVALHFVLLMILVSAAVRALRRQDGRGAARSLLE